VIAPVTILGAGMNIVPAALTHFGGKEVRIFIHGDDNGQGQEAAKRWAQKLTSAGAVISGFSLEADLNDFVHNLREASHKDKYFVFLHKAFG
jgi:UDP-N-acetyl-D-mannosaminuronic acid transferase (WecB/TagA/CpsF family)